MAKEATKSMANPVRLKPVNKSDGIIQVIIETPKGSRNKFAFDVKQNIFTVKKVLPAGMTFPYDFGFLPRTLAPDGDPIDVLLLMDEPAFPGIAVRARLIGIIEGEQTDGKKTIRNDRLLAVAEVNHEYRLPQEVWTTCPKNSSANSKSFSSTTTASKARNTRSSAAKKSMPLCA